VIVINHEVELPTVGSKVYVEVTVIRHPNSFSVNLPYGNVDMAKVSIAFLEEQKTVLELGNGHYKPFLYRYFMFRCAWT
jgi:hypothetical protein